MATTVGERFTQLIESLGMNESSFAKSIDKSRSMIGLVVSGKSKPGFEFLELICLKFPQVNPNWLLTGEGDMFRVERPSKQADRYLQEHLQTLEENFARLASQMESKDKQFDSLLSQKDSVIESLQSVIEYQKQLLTKKEQSFLNGVSLEGRIVPLYPEQEKALA